MGWTSTNRAAMMSTRAFLENEFPTMLGECGEIVASGMDGSTFYAAVRQKDSGEVWALVVLTQRSSGYYNFSYKEMSESMGPNEVGAPAKVLDALTPTEDQYALEWRQECREQLAKRAAAKKVKAGTVIEFEQPVKFSDGFEYSRFVFEGGNVFQAKGGPRVRFTGWRKRKWSIVEEVAA